jgi:hypothetical protein
VRRVRRKKREWEEEERRRGGDEKDFFSKLITRVDFFGAPPSSE